MIYMLSVLICLGFAIWSGLEKELYVYPLNFIILFIASSIINTSYIQGITRGWSYISIYGIKGIHKALGINIITTILMLIAYFITKLVFSINLQYVLFFIACITLSTIVAFIDDQFQLAIEKTKALENFYED